MTTNHDSPMTHNETLEKLRDLIKGIKICMLTTVAQDGSLRSRPMSTQDAEFDGDLWFFTYDNEGKATEIERIPAVNVAYADTGKQRYVSASGTASLVHDRAKMEQFWNPLLKAFFPDGLETPNIALIKVAVEEAEYWESDGRIASLLQFAKAALTGTEAEPGENRKLTL